ncbi:MAG TPA: phytanoyl-CoA dioxygenase family protein [Candidatus Limnocylindrales bacterium]
MLTSNGYVLDESSRRLGELEAVPDSERHDRDALWERLRRDGYLFLRGALDPEPVHAFRAHYFTKLAAAGVTAAGTAPPVGVAGAADTIDREALRHILFQEIVPGPEYAAFCGQPAIRDWYNWFLGEQPVLHRRKILRHNRPGEHGVGTATQAHYDLVYLREGTDRVLASWIPLGDCPLDRGGLTYLEGSHHWVGRSERDGTLSGHPATSLTADLPSLADEHDARWLVTDYRAGDMVVHSAYIVHAGIDNADPQRVMRLSTDIRYQRVSEPIDWRWKYEWEDGDHARRWL